MAAEWSLYGQSGGGRGNRCPRSKKAVEDGNVPLGVLAASGFIVPGYGAAKGIAKEVGEQVAKKTAKKARIRLLKKLQRQQPREENMAKTLEEIYRNNLTTYLSLQKPGKNSTKESNKPAPATSTEPQSKSKTKPST